MFGKLVTLRERPIDQTDLASDRAMNYRAWPLDKSGVLYLESLVSVENFSLRGRNHYAHDRNPPYWHEAPGAIDALLLRQSVAERLTTVDKRLGAEGLRLHLYDAWRPRAVQDYFYSIWTPREIARRRPDLIGDALTAEVRRYWAKPTDDPDQPAPHATGAAVDLTITQDDGTPLWMGSLFDDPSPLSHLEHFEADQMPGAVALSNEEARGNRRLLYWLMREVGFVGLASEWWHYSWGDQMWAMRTGAPAAHYGLIEPA